MNCSKCGASVSLWKRDLASGLCPTCLAAQRKAEQEAQALAASREAAIRHGIPQAYPGGCPNCGGDLVPILLFAREDFNLRQGLGVDAAVAYYAAPEGDQGVFTGRFRVAGSVRASKCSNCHRIHLNGVPEV